MHRCTVLPGWLAILFACAGTWMPAFADSLATIRERGVLHVGTKIDYHPYGFQTETGDIVGLEPDLAEDVAVRFGVDLRLVPVLTATRLRYLVAGRIDLIIATMGINKERARIVEFVDPPYYAGEQAAFTHRSSLIGGWDDLDGRWVCGVRGAQYNADVQVRGARLVVFRNPNLALAGLRAGRCGVMVYDTTWLGQFLGRPDWADFIMPLPSIRPSFWGIAVNKGDLALRDALAEIVRDWHASGRLLELEKKWGAAPSSFLKDMHLEFRG